MRSRLAALGLGLSCWAGALLAAQPAEPDPVENATPPAEATPETGAPLPADTIAPGTEITLRTTAEISGQRVRKGDLFKLEVVEDFVIGERVLIPKGTAAVAEFTRAEPSGMMGRGGHLAARVRYLELPQGTVRLTGELSESGRNQTGLAAVTALVGFGIFIKGKAAVIPAGTELLVVLDREARFPAPPS